MATFSVCDRCKTKLNAETRWVKLKPAVQMGERTSMSAESDIDLCGDCFDSVMKGFKSFALTEKEKDERTDRPRSTRG